MKREPIDWDDGFQRYSTSLNSEGFHIFDVSVVGAGPAGWAAATLLAQKGLKVLLLEKAPLPRYKTCGGGILRRAWQMLPPQASTLVERSFTSVLLNFSGENMQFTVSRPEPLVRMTMRADLDNFLAKEARVLGVTLRDGCPALAITQNPDSVEITTAQGKFKSRFLVASDGAQSFTAKACGWSALPKLAPALEWELHLSAANFARFGQTARFDFGVIDAGYAWVFPKRNHLSVGILTTGRANLDLAKKLRTYLDYVGISQIERIEKHGYVIPLEPRREPLARGRVLLAGDAAGLVDPITAEGISNALWSGRLAAEAIGADGAEAAEVGRRYQELLEKNILGDLRAGRWLAHFVYHRPRIRHWAFHTQGRRLANFAADVVMGEKGYRAALRDPRNYLKMLGWR